MLVHNSSAVMDGTNKPLLHTGLGYLGFFPGIENLSLPVLSYPGFQVTSSCKIASKRIQAIPETYFKIDK